MNRTRVRAHPVCVCTFFHPDRKAPPTATEAPPISTTATPTLAEETDIDAVEGGPVPEPDESSSDRGVTDLDATESSDLHTDKVLHRDTSKYCTGTHQKWCTGHIKVLHQDTSSTAPGQYCTRTHQSTAPDTSLTKYCTGHITDKVLHRDTSKYCTGTHQSTAPGHIKVLHLDTSLTKYCTGTHH
ncbi:hypothetical protein WMY93_024616 [Mugilogobius chulae]|uniref:Uncharacterized protein n=1 Tax=Mugilogobius chulae TaxID=88201 RepID=A0AAW0NCN1_9GOBI